MKLVLVPTHHIYMDI